jgi:hypothetical protein
MDGRLAYRHTTMMQVLANFSCVRPCSPPVRYPLRLEIVRAEIQRGPDAGETAAACDDGDDPDGLVAARKRLCYATCECLRDCCGYSGDGRNMSLLANKRSHSAISRPDHPSPRTPLKFFTTQGQATARPCLFRG